MAEETSKELDETEIESEESRLRKMAINDYLALMTRIVEIVIRYLQFRLRELAAGGIKIHNSVDVKYLDKGMLITIKLEVPDELIEDYMKHVKFVRRRLAKARHTDKEFYRFDEDEKRILAEEKEMKLGEEGEP